MDKKKISKEKMAQGVYSGIIKQTIKKPIEDSEDNIILTKEEQTLLLLSFLYNLLSSQKMEDIQPYLTSLFVNDYKNVEDEGE